MLTSETIRKPVGLVRATSIVMVATLAAAVFGLVREALVAARFGTTVETDAYFFAFDLVVSLPEFMLSAIGACLIPVYLRSKKEEQTSSFISTVINVYLLLLLLTTILLLVTAPFSVALLASGFDVASQQLIILMIRVLAPTVILIGLWGLLKTLLNAEGEFFVSTFSQALQSVGIIAAVWLFVPQLGIFSLPFGILLAAVMQVVWTVYWLKRKGFQYQWKIDLRNPQFRHYLALIGPTLAGGVIIYIEPILDKSLASHLAEGTIASLSFAGRPMALLTRIVVYSFVTALLPSLAWTMTHRGRESFRTNVVQILNMLMFVIIPLSVLLIALRVPIIQVLFERGKFEATATVATANIFAGLVIGLLPLAMTVTLSTVFISLEDTTTPALWGAGSSFVAKIVLSLLLLGPLGAGGLALATSFKSVVAGMLLLLRLRRRLQGIDGRYLVIAFGRILFISCVAISPVYWMTLTLDLSPLLLTVTGTSIATIVYVGLSMLVQAPEVQLVQSYLRSKKA